METLFAVLLALLLLLSGEVIRRRLATLRRIFVPASIIAGVFGLLLGPQVLGRVAAHVDLPGVSEQGLWSETVLDIWSSLPGILINVVFASLFIGKTIPGIREIWLRAGPQIVFGQSLAWGQYVVGLSLALLILGPVFGLSPIAGTLISIGFEGGHGTSVGMAEAFEAAGFAEGGDLALGLATVGLVSAVLIGTVLINWAARRDQLSFPRSESGSPSSAPDDQLELSDEDKRELKKQKRLADLATDGMSLQLALIGLAIAIGWLLLEGLQLLERLTWGGELFTYLPLFPLAMIGGLLIQLAIDRWDMSHLVVRSYVTRTGGVALDLTIVMALASISLQVIGDNLVPFLLLAAGGTAWCLFGLLVIAPRVIPYNWFERGVGDFGQSMGMTISGLLLMRMADPQNKSGAMDSFGYKQLLFEPIVGGGLFTGMSVALVANYGAMAVLLLCGALTAAWLIFGFLYFGPLVKQERARQSNQEKH